MLALRWLALTTAIAAPTTMDGNLATQGGDVRLVYELYSWRSEASDEWQFTLLSGLTSHVKRPEEIFDPKKVLTGLEALEARLADLPQGSEVVWIEAIRSLKRDPTSGRVEEGNPVAGTERLELPPKSVISKVKVLTRKYKLHLEVGTRGGR